MTSRIGKGPGAADVVGLSGIGCVVATELSSAVGCGCVVSMDGEGGPGMMLAPDEEGNGSIVGGVCVMLVAEGSGRSVGGGRVLLDELGLSVPDDNGPGPGGTGGDWVPARVTVTVAVGAPTLIVVM